MNRTKRRQRAAFTLVEIFAVTTIMAVMAVSTFALVRTANAAWKRHRDDSERRREAIAALQHVVRRLRQATAVAAISGSTDASGYISATMADGSTSAWDHDAAVNRIFYGNPTADNLLAEGIASMTFVGFTANGQTIAADPDDIHLVHCRLGYSLPRPGGSVTEYVSGMAWLRAW
ncbi:MAG: hypothetical protein DCC67_01435 [Planctomycetota bacterium]|nr:MAG: hypothetical protein DCC67_01435 [Planctomycetota bacterium]